MVGILVLKDEEDVNVTMRRLLAVNRSRRWALLAAPDLNATTGFVSGFVRAVLLMGSHALLLISVRGGGTASGHVRLTTMGGALAHIDILPVQKDEDS